MLAAAAHAQTPPAPATEPTAAASAATLAPVVVTGQAPVPASVAGFGDIPLAETPLQASSFSFERLRDLGARTLADLVRLDASVSDSYNSEGYITYFQVRGFLLDNRFNYRRDGLPINAETSIPLENKARVDILEGLSGMQVGTSAPGGLVDVVVKRPLDAPLRSAFVEYRQRGSVLGAADLSQRFGGSDGKAFGLRLNVAAQHIDPQVRNAEGNRNLFALAGDWRLSPSTLVEAEIENSHRSQPSQAAFSLLGSSVPSVPNPRLNLNNQPWSLPVVFDATTASLRLTQKLSADWRVVAQAQTQHLRTDDREAFPFGCSAADGTYYAHSYCPDGSFDLYDFRSENERRRSTTSDIALHGKAATGPLTHQFVGGVQRTLVKNRFQDSAFNPVGSGNVDGSVVRPPDPTLTTPNTDRDERSTELYLRDAIALGLRSTLWLGARQTRLVRSSEPTTADLLNPPTRYRQSISSPFAALSYAFAPGQLVYASYGQGAQSNVVPTNAVRVAGGGATAPLYSNAGQALPAARSRQIEAGIKGGTSWLEATAAVFDIRQPLFGDVGACDLPGSCTRELTGTQRHRGLEADATWRSGGAWSLRGSVQWLHARVQTPLDPTQDGKRPVNVPAVSARAEARYAVAAVPGLTLLLASTYDSGREVLPDNSVSIPSVTRFDLGARHELRAGGIAWTLRAGIDNLFDRRAWREAPYQFDHAYLFPLAPRTARVSVEAAL